MAMVRTQSDDGVVVERRLRAEIPSRLDGIGAMWRKQS